MNESLAVDVQNVSKSFGAVTALDGVSLQVRRGEIYGLLGPNGAGKTTLIRMLVGLLEAHAGTVTVLSHRMPDVGVLRHVGYMTQMAALYPGLSVEENVAILRGHQRRRGRSEGGARAGPPLRPARRPWSPRSAAA